ncbi:DUF393 domain-containing protein [Paenibacillus profundus]|uniref:DUF393 domain-containing protein n=1 Tax=Paenibacillus profundus TaxID=1173085 RepID=A0ABS8YFB4_9BACL|nr:DUF393 domain-containing protein [Paenibacillus profundus]MCE5169752.1 DUF393 domain-containing protein [Paenibacillus profundus]
MNVRKRLLIEVYYDGWCPLCKGIRRRLERWDWLGCLRFYSIRNPEEIQHVSVSPQELEARMHVRTVHDGCMQSGIAAVHMLCTRVPLLMPISPFVWLGMKSGIGDKLYDWIATRRSIVPSGACDDQGCSIHQDHLDKKN